MTDSPVISRRSFLYGAAFTGAAAALSACSSSGSASSDGSSGDSGSGGGGKPNIGGQAGSATTPLPTPASFSESPALKGKGLPPVKERLPKNPLVVPHHWVNRGKYGGSLHVSAFGTTGMANASSTHEYFYGYSPLRWLNDGLDIGPGIMDTWTPNKDTSQWTLHFREGLKWSDGVPFTVDDILFWWEDMVLPGHDAHTPPPECVSPKGTLCKMRKVDDSTLVLTFDSPQPIFPDVLASWAKGNIGQNGPVWVYPKHYLKQFHPKYNKSVPKDWDTSGGLWEQKAAWVRNPECPTLAGFRCRSWDNNKGATLERNPYYYVVTKDGDQVPYLDTMNVTLFQDAQVIKLQVQQGKVDYCHGTFNQMDMSDVSTLSKSKDQGDYHIELWDGGSGTASMFFLNYDYPEKKYRDLFRDKRFRQAISHAYDRETIRKSLYFETGEISTGTMGPKATEFHTKPDGPTLYAQWRDSYKELDVEKAKSLLADLGLKDTDGDGYVEFPDGSKLTVDVPYSADISPTEGAKDDQLVSDTKKIGLRMVRRAVPPQSFGDQWSNGKLMSHTNWEISNGNIRSGAEWLLPLESSRWSPLQGAYYQTLGTSREHEEENVDPWKRHPPRIAPEKGSPVARMWDLYNQARRDPDAMAWNRLIWKIIKIHIDEGPFFMGTLAGYPVPIVVNNDLRNVPSADQLAQHGNANPWHIPCPAVYDPEVFYWENPDKHT
ncbi:MAG TPA: ABC transporter substrate-binding protein [Mycobacteriales bacterium]|nr:ABC transporter substrate-binding protein [Mycobacteriales bacterium]